MATYIILTRDGVADSGQEAKLAALAAELQRPGAKLLLHLHGGLVDQATGEANAARLGAGGPQSWQRDASWTQVYVVWRTGALETIRSNWRELVDDDRLYKALLRRLIAFIGRKLGTPRPGGRGIATFGLDDAEISRRLLGQGDPAAPFEDIEDQLPVDSSGTRAALEPAQSDGALALEFQDELRHDAAFQAAAAEIAEAANVPPGARAGTAGGKAAAGEQMRRRLDSRIQDELDPPAAVAGTTRGLVSSAGMLVTAGGRIAWRCFRRFRSRRDHGFHATIVEELCRELYGDFIGARIWGMMVGDAADHFRARGFGASLVAMLRATPPEKMVVTAHSAGSIWATHLLDALQAAAGPTRVRLVLLAPAVRHDLFVGMLGRAGGLIERCHLFGMSDPLERRDAVLGHQYGYIYPSSLLYLVSGLFEERRAGEAYVDTPLLGMARFAGAAWLDPAEQANARAVASFFEGADRSISLSPKAGVTMADSHGAFDDEPVTLASARQYF